MIRVVFRFDDPSQTSNHSLEREIIERFFKHKLIATFSVIPFRNSVDGLIPFTFDQAAHLIAARRNAVIEIALHGFAHLRRAIRQKNFDPTEFAGLPETQQVDLIQKGREHLQKLFDVPINGFVPPWNSYDATTLRALERVGLKYLSGAWKFPLEYQGKITILPATCNLLRLRLAVTQAHSFTQLDPILVVPMHHYDFSETGNPNATTSLYEFNNVLEWIKLQDGVQVVTLNDIAAIITPQQSARVLYLEKRKQRLHWRLQAYFPGDYFVNKPLWQVLIKTVSYRIRTLLH